MIILLFTLLYKKIRIFFILPLYYNNNGGGENIWSSRDLTLLFRTQITVLNTFTSRPFGWKPTPRTAALY